MKLTKGAIKVLTYYQKYIEANKFVTAMREVAKGVGWRLTSISLFARYVDELERKGYIYKEPRSARALRILKLYDGDK